MKKFGHTFVSASPGHQILVPEMPSSPAKYWDMTQDHSSIHDLMAYHTYAKVYRPEWHVPYDAPFYFFTASHRKILADHCETEVLRLGLPLELLRRAGCEFEMHSTYYDHGGSKISKMKFFGVDFVELACRPVLFELLERWSSAPSAPPESAAAAGALVIEAMKVARKEIYAEEKYLARRRSTPTTTRRSQPSQTSPRRRNSRRSS